MAGIFKNILTLIPAAFATAVAALPVLTCPACWPLYAGFLSAAGLGFVDYTPYLFPVTAFLLVVSLLPLLWKAQSRRGYMPFITAVAAAVLILFGKFRLDENMVYYAGIALLLAASIWNIWPQQKRRTDCQSCAVHHGTNEV